MKQLKNVVLSQIKKILYGFRTHHLPQAFLHEGVPYFSQWESRELNKAILARTIDAKNDPKWKESGAATKEEYALWSWTGCGMACTKMLLARSTGTAHQLVDLGKKCAEYGGYTMPLEESKGLLYGPYTKFLRAEFDMDARVVSPLLPGEIMHELSRGNYVIASVSPDIRHPDGKPAQKGGHLILMLGYNLEKQILYFHNPSGDSVATQEYAEISFDRFKNFFSGRGIVVDGKDNMNQK